MSKTEPDKETIETWNKVALLYQDKFMNLTIYDRTYDKYCDLLKKKGSNVLDIGCGPGNITKYLLRKRPDLQVTGVDAAPRMIELARKNNPESKFMEMDCRRIDTLTSGFEGVVIGFCLPYLSENDCRKLVADCSLLLKENGAMYLSFVEGENDQSGFQVGSSGQRMFFYYHTLEKIKKLLSENHFELPEIIKVDYKKNPDLTEVHTVLLTRKIN